MRNPDKKGTLSRVASAENYSAHAFDARQEGRGNPLLLERPEACPACRHPNIVAYRDSFLDSGGYLCIVMEYCEHGDLSTYLQEAKRAHKVPEEGW